MAEAVPPGKGKKKTKDRVVAVRARSMLVILREIYPDAHCALRFNGPFQLLIATILSAQCTDTQVNRVTPALFARYPDAEAMANADLQELERLVNSTGFYRSKAKNLLGCAMMLQEKYLGQVPQTMEELTELPGVGRKTANVVLGNVFNRPAMVVDTHVKRLSRRFGWTVERDPGKIERDLCALLPEEEWVMAGHLLIRHGREICKSPLPFCSSCPLQALCPKIGVDKAR